MSKTTQGRSGNRGELEVIESVTCPNCRSRLMQLPPLFPLFEVQCTRCMFRAQIKTARCKPKSQIFGAGWDVLDKTLKSGQLIPPLIVNFRWTERGLGDCQEIYFFPFLTKNNVRMRQRSPDGKRPNYREFNYIELFSENVPRMLLFERHARRRRAQTRG